MRARGFRDANVLDGASHHEAAKMLLTVNEDNNFIRRADRLVFVIGQTAVVALLLATPPG